MSFKTINIISLISFCLIINHTLGLLNDPCTQDTQCGDINLICSQGICQKKCNNVKDCSQGQYCIKKNGCAGICLPRKCEGNIVCHDQNVCVNGKCLCGTAQEDCSIISKVCLNGKCVCDPRIQFGNKIYYAKPYYLDNCDQFLGINSCDANPAVCQDKTSDQYKTVCEISGNPKPCNPQCVQVNEMMGCAIEYLGPV